jgi:hypothetical protein
MKGYNKWSYAPYRPFLYSVGKPYICRVIPGVAEVQIEWLKENMTNFEVFYRKRDKGEFVKAGETIGDLFVIDGLEAETDYEFLRNGASSPWQLSSNMCGLPERHLENITLRNIEMELDGGVQEYSTDVPDGAQGYPEINVYGNSLPAKGIFFRHLDGLTLDNVTVKTYRPDARPDFEFRNITDLKK